MFLLCVLYCRDKTQKPGQSEQANKHTDYKNPGWGGRDFPQTFRPALKHTQPPLQWVPGHYPGSKAAHLASRLKKELSYTSTSRLGLFWPVLSFIHKINKCQVSQVNNLWPVRVLFIAQYKFHISPAYSKVWSLNMQTDGHTRIHQLS